MNVHGNAHGNGTPRPGQADRPLAYAMSAPSPGRSSALFLGLLNIGTGIMSIPIDYQYMIKALVLLVAVYFDVSSKRQRHDFPPRAGPDLLRGPARGSPQRRQILR